MYPFLFARNFPGTRKWGFFIFLTLLLSSAILVPPVSAHCPLCTAGAAIGVGVAREMGVDDSIVGLFLGAFVAASGLWLDRILKKRNIDYPLQGMILVAVSLLSVAVPLYYAGVITNTAVVRSLTDYHSLFGLEAFGIDKLFGGLLFGTVLITGVFTLSDYVTRIRGGRLFRFQGMVLMAVALALCAIAFWRLTA